VTTETPAPTPDHKAAAPLLRVVSGSPNAEELAVVVAVLASRAAPAPVEPAWSLWNRKSRMVRPSLRPGFGAWRASTMPR
jgi:Acyl-CoA carboxylase epsilon subunit